MRLWQILSEATTTWVGPFSNELGNGKPYTLNYGTGSPGRPSILYIPIPLDIVRSHKRKLEPKYGRLTHVGEAHVTVSMGPELSAALGDDPLRTLVDRGLFNSSGDGIPVEVGHTGRYRWMRAPFYKDEADPEGPALISELVDVPQLVEIRTSLGLSPLPKIPGQEVYYPHVTIGYMSNLDKIHQSYMDRDGRDR